MLGAMQFQHFKISSHIKLKHLTMKSFQLILLCFICIAKSYGQTVTKSYYRIVVEVTKEKKSKKNYPKVDIKSVFPVEDSTWMKSIEKNITQSIQVGKRVKKGKYIFSVVFILAKGGNISDIRCENDPGFGMCEEVVRVIKKSPKWAPAGGVRVRVVNAYNQ
jgi:hypothetical protein